VLQGLLQLVISSTNSQNGMEFSYLFCFFLLLLFNIISIQHLLMYEKTEDD
jgi:hypothetical protein